MLAASYETVIRGRALRVLLVDMQEHVSPTRLAEQLYGQTRNELTVADVLVIRPPIDRPVADANEVVEHMQPVFERVAKLPVHLLTSKGFRHELSKNVHPDVDELIADEERLELLTALQQIELAEIARQSKAVIDTRGATMFRTPSKSYCHRFLRAGNVQINRATLDVFFFWMLPWLQDCHAIVAESWTISSLVLNATRLLARYSPDQGRCKVEMLAAYYDASSEAEITAEAILERALHTSQGAALVVFSACMSGKAVSRLKAITERHCPAGLTARFVSLYNLAENLPIDCLCDLFRHMPADFFRHYEELPASPHEIRVIDIDRVTYFPSVIHEVKVSIQEADALPARQFFEDYGAANAFLVHRDSYVAGQKYRHHAIYPEISALLKQDCFKERLRTKLAGLDKRPELIVIPPHGAGRELAEFASAFLGSIPVREHLDLVFPREPSAQEEDLLRKLQAMNDSSAILVLDDVSVTGNRLSRYQRSLRDFFRGQIHYFVGLARPEKLDSWTRRTRELRYRKGFALKHTVTTVELLVLPDWDEACCPWCAEQRLYRKLAFQNGELPALLARRNADLAASESLAFVAHPSDFIFRLTKNSLFAPVDSSPATVFAAVCSALQQLRTESNATRSLAHHDYPQVNSLDPQDYLGTTFTDPILRVAILRATHRSELERVSAEHEAERGQAARLLLVSADATERCLAIELLLAMSLRKLPTIPLTDQDRQLPHLAELNSLIEALATLH
jgi:hypothetical protein